MKNSAIIFDLDGTVLDSPIEKLPSKKLIDAINKIRHKYHLCIATGRAWTFSKIVIETLKLTDPCITSAGSQIYNPVTKEVLWQRDINKKSLARAISIFQEYPNFKLLYNDNAEADYFYGGIYPNDFKVRENVYFLEQIFVPDEIAIEISEKINTIDDITCTMVIAQKNGCRDLHVVDKYATKEHAISKLLEIIGIKKINTIGIGDGHNDLNLFKAVHKKVAMGNAVLELKNVADIEIGHVADDGLADYFNTLI